MPERLKEQAKIKDKYRDSGFANDDRYGMNFRDRTLEVQPRR